jgi:sporulation protein YlmC with PRC-barrel domain
MSGTSQFTLGAEVSCTDGVCGKVISVVVDPVAKAVTLLAVEPKHRQGLARFVPLELVDNTATDEVRLRCTVAEFGKLDLAEEIRYLPGTEGGLGPVGMVGLDGNAGNFAQPLVYDLVPSGEVEVRRGEPVHATDGEIGRVQGVLTDPAGHHITHVLLQEGHLWGRKQVAIPIGAVTEVADGVHLRISKQEVQDLPQVDSEHPAG